MSFALDPFDFPLHGARLIEASAGTGKTWTIAALYVRLVLGHGGAAAFERPLAPAGILVMTFTRAATRELSARIRERLLQAARCFRGETPHDGDAFLHRLLDAYAEGAERDRAAHRLMLAAEAMDEAAVFTIDAWCQRMLREHAFDSACLFDEELVASEEELFRHAVRDYWRGQVYALGGAALASVRACWRGLEDLEQAMRALVPKVALLGPGRDEPLGALVGRFRHEQAEAAQALKEGWTGRVERMRHWYDANRAALNGGRLRQATVEAFFSDLAEWAADPLVVLPGEGFGKAWDKMDPEKLAGMGKKGMAIAPAPEFADVAPLARRLAELEPLEHALMRHGARAVARRMEQLKRHSRQFGFADMLARLKEALEGPNGATLRQRILGQYPVAMIDEFQDTSPDQYRIFDLLYQAAQAASTHGMFLIGDPKQAIYGFRGADIHSYLAARAATEGRHYRLGTNYRSSAALVAAVNQLFLHAEGQGADGTEGGEGGHAAGAFHFRRDGANPLPFEPVAANGRGETLVEAAGEVAPLTVWCHSGTELKVDDYLAHFGKLCAARIVALLNDPQAGFDGPDGFARLRPADIAVLVRDRKEARAVRRALQACHVASVYLSDQDSVFQGQEARDILRWLRAVAAPLDAALGRAAFAAPSAGLSLASLARLASDDLAWDARVEQLKALRQAWQRQGVLAMLRRFIHELELPAALLSQPGGERRLTNLLHLAELLQQASGQLDGEQALIRWLAEQIAGDGAAGDERILRLESDAELVQVVTVHKSKGLEYPLVFLPFAVSARPVTKRDRDFCEYPGPDGQSVIDFSLSQEAIAAMDAARLEEDLRLFYVAATRARHALWLGVANIKDRFERCALGYLLAGGDKVAAADLAPRLRAMAGDCPHIHVVAAEESPAPARLRARETPLLAEASAVPYAARFERDWGIASYTSIARDLGAMRAPATPLEEKLLEDDDPLPPSGAPAGRGGAEPWHRFPRGALAGQFLHEQLEWMAQEGFDVIHADNFDARLAARCERAGWGQRHEELAAWLRVAAEAPLPPLGAALCQLEGALPETEFWLPADALRSAALDRLCGEHLLPGVARPPLQERQLQGMLRGFMDLVFEWDGRYWVLDYKSNALGQGDAAYHAGALAEAMARHRYDVQGAIYLLALHRLLQSRLGAGYDPARQLGGAVFYFLRGAMHPATGGCCRLAPEAGFLERLDAMFPRALHEGAAA